MYLLPVQDPATPYCESQSFRFSARAKNKGWRIDYCMVSEPMKAQVEKAYILNEAVHSDHCPAVIEVS